MKILFICTGNICRSPLAAAILRQLAADAGCDIQTDSAGTFGMYAPTPPDPMMVKVAGEAGYQLDGLSRKVTREDLQSSDLVFCMGVANFFDTKAMLPQSSGKIREFVDYIDGEWLREIPDPYGGSEADFRKSFQYIERGCRNILTNLINKK